MIVRDAHDANLSASIDAEIFHVCRNLRPEDRREQFAARWTDDPDALGTELVALRPFAIKHYALCCDDGEPAILVGAFVRSPRVASFHMCATPRLAEIGRDAHRFGRRRFIPFVLAPNVVRAEARILADHAEARRWVRTFGFAEEGIVTALGKQGEDFVQVAWINPQRGDVA